MKKDYNPFQFLKDVDHINDSIFIHHTKIEEQLPMHKHHKHQLSYIEGGVAFLNTPTNSYFLPARHFIWMPAGMEHNVELRSPFIMVRNLYFPVDLFPKDHKLRTMGIYPVTDLIKEMILFTEEWKGGFTKEQTHQHEFLIALRNVLMAVSRVPIPIALPTTKNELLKPILKYIHHNLEEPLKLNLVAKEFGMSSRSLSRIFREHIDISFLQYLKMTRVIRSMEMLLETNKSISEIAYTYRYSSIGAFSNVFYQISHIRPVDFRKQNLKKGGK
ncbi:AraC family transcriptional regulator [Polaribacter undariae]|uniref:AraC family transcriptional regulator n=1 Tax=Polaribacter sejongensis TaxID=985043 RepID=A0AAJ1QWS9_9FLAO|nr:AraC family transcriptional regulator [Polaribacter undariae]MDN3619626.1 AraC family transcriptional regulator [Polaribacter undariae]UWD32260.1 AraC family transcriptional regulator [Polaribacter undariae]